MRIIGTVTKSFYLYMIITASKSSIVEYVCIIHTCLVALMRAAILFCFVSIVGVSEYRQLIR